MSTGQMIDEKSRLEQQSAQLRSQLLEMIGQAPELTLAVARGWVTRQFEARIMANATWYDTLGPLQSGGIRDIQMRFNDELPARVAVLLSQVTDGLDAILAAPPKHAILHRVLWQLAAPLGQILADGGFSALLPGGTTPWAVHEGKVQLSADYTFQPEVLSPGLGGKFEHLSKAIEEVADELRRCNASLAGMA